MPACLKRKRDLEDVLVVSGLQLLGTSLALRETKRLRSCLESPDPNLEEAENAYDIERAASDALFNASIGIIKLASTFSGAGSRGSYDQITRCKEFFPTALSWPDKEFRHTFRMSRRTFDHLVALLEKNTIFHSPGKKPQRPVRYQLACFLMRYSVRGGDSMLAAKQLGIGLGTVFLYCRRVARALRELGVQVLTWGNDERHEAVAEYILENFGFEDCLGIVDGSLIRLTQSPRVMGLVYYCRKKYPALNVQAVVDHECRFISFDMGWPGSVPDVSVWKRSRLWRLRHWYFREGQYILADKGYPSSPYTLRPFTQPELDEVSRPERTRRYAFNQRLSSCRIRVEHAFGRLKARFPALHDLTPAENIGDTYRDIHAMMVLHNICVDLQDSPEDFLSEPGNEEDVHDNWDVELPDYHALFPEQGADIPLHETDAWLRQEGHRKRLQILDRLFPL